MSSATLPTLISAAGGDRTALADALATWVADLPHPPRLLGFGEPMHGEDGLLRLRNAVFAALVERAGFTTISLESSAWHGRLVADHVAGSDAADEDEVMSAGFTHGWGAWPANRDLVRWMREQNRHRPPGQRLRFAPFDAPTEIGEAPSPRAALRVLHDHLRTHGGELDLPPWDALDDLLGPDGPWEEPAAARDPARSIGDRPRAHELRAIVDDLTRTLTGERPRLRHEMDPADLDDALLAARTAADLLAYHAVIAQDTEHRYQRMAAVRDAMMAENLQAIAARGRTLVCAHNAHVRTGTVTMPFGPTTLRWQPVGAHLADRFGPDYRVVACAVGDAARADIPEPGPDTLEGFLRRSLPPGDHLLPAAALRSLRQAPRPAGFNYFPLDDTLLDQVDEVLFLRRV